MSIIKNSGWRCGATRKDHGAREARHSRYSLCSIISRKGTLASEYLANASYLARSRHCVSRSLSAAFVFFAGGVNGQGFASQAGCDVHSCGVTTAGFCISPQVERVNRSKAIRIIWISLCALRNAQTHANPRPMCLSLGRLRRIIVA